MELCLLYVSRKYMNTSYVWLLFKNNFVIVPHVLVYVRMVCVEESGWKKGDEIKLKQVDTLSAV